MTHDPTVNSPKYNVATYTTWPPWDFHWEEDTAVADTKKRPAYRNVCYIRAPGAWQRHRGKKSYEAGDITWQYSGIKFSWTSDTGRRLLHYKSRSVRLLYRRALSRFPSHRSRLPLSHFHRWHTWQRRRNQPDGTYRKQPGGIGRAPVMTMCVVQMAAAVAERLQ